MAINVGDIEAVLRLREEMSAQIETSISTLKKLNSALGQTDSAMESTEKHSLALGVAMGEVLGGWIEKASEMLIDFGKEAITTAARVETLTGVSRFLGNQVGFTNAEIDALSASLQKQGITTQQSRDTINQLIRANLDLGKATQLATVAQSAARLSGENSSETLNRIIHGVQTLQPEILRSAGIIVNMEVETTKWAAANNRTVATISGAEKQQILLNATLREGEKIAGVYGVTNDFVGGKIQSLKRYFEEAGLALGQQFLPALKTGVDGLTIFLKSVKESPDAFTALAGAIIATGTAMSVSWALPAAAVAISLDLIASAFTGTLDPMTNFKAILGFLSDLASSVADAVKKLTGGFVDFKVAVDNAALTSQALRHEWLEMKSTALGVQEILAKGDLRQAEGSGADRLRIDTIKSYIANLEIEKKAVDASIKSIEDGTIVIKEHGAATKNTAQDLLDLQKHATELAAATAAAARKEAEHAAALKAAAEAAKKHASEIKALTEQYTSMFAGLTSSKETDKITVLWKVISDNFTKLTDNDLLKAIAKFKEFGTEGQKQLSQLNTMIEMSGRIFARTFTVSGVPGLGKLLSDNIDPSLFEKQAHDAANAFDDGFEREAAARKWFFANIPADIGKDKYEAVAKALGITLDTGKVKTVEITKATFDWSKMIGTVHDAMELMGVKSDSTLGKIVSSVTLAISGFKDFQAQNKSLADEISKQTDLAIASNPMRDYKDSVAAAMDTSAVKVKEQEKAFSQLQRGIIAAATAVQIYTQNSHNLSAANATASGAAQGAATGAQLGGAWGALIGGVAGALDGYFSGQGFRQQMKAAGAVMGVEMTDALAKAVTDTMDKFNKQHDSITGAALFHITAQDAGLLSLDKAMDSSLLKAHSFAPQVFALIAGIAAGALPVKEALEQVNKAFIAMETEAGPGRVTTQMLGLMAAAKAAHIEIKAMTDLIVSLATNAAPKLASAWKTLEQNGSTLGFTEDQITDKLQRYERELKASGATEDEVSQKLAQRQRELEKTRTATDATAQSMELLARLTAADFDAMMSAGMSMVDIFEKLGPTIDAAVDAYNRLGLAIPDVLANIVQLRNFVSVNKDLADLLAGLPDIIKLAEAGFGSLGDAITLTLTTLNDTEAKLIAGGMDAAHAHAMALYLTRDAAREVQYAYEHGLLPNIDAATKSWLDEEKAAGNLDPTPQDHMNTSMDMTVQLLALLVQKFGVELPKSISDYITALNNIPKDINTNVNITNPGPPPDPGRNGNGSSPSWHWTGNGPPQGHPPGQDWAWYQHGFDGIVSSPRMFGAGEAGPERVTITPVHSNGTDVNTSNGGVTVNVTVMGDGDAAKIKNVVLSALRNNPDGFRTEAKRHLGVDA